MKKLLFLFVIFLIAFDAMAIEGKGLGGKPNPEVELVGKVMPSEEVTANPYPEPDELLAIDKPNDEGKTIILTWKVMPYDNPKNKYVVYMGENPLGPFYPQGEYISTVNLKSDLPASFWFYKDNESYHAVEITGFKAPAKDKPTEIATTDFDSEKNYFFKLALKDENGTEFSFSKVTSGKAYSNWFDFSKLNSFILMVIMMTLILFFINQAKKNKELFIRRINGLEAIDEALGRATEMGKSVFFIHGINAMSDLPGIAAVNILGRIAGKVAEYDTAIKVLNNDPIVYQVSQETVKEAYIKAGRPDAYREESVVFAAADQFSYAAAVEGLMVREKPAANFMFGYFYAEALLLSETGSSTGAIQVAGTDAYTQIPFFITSCDYTLMGEELYAASAYLSREPKLLGSLKGQDIGKGILILIIILGIILSTCGYELFAKLFWPL